MTFKQWLGRERTSITIPKGFVPVGFRDPIPNTGEYVMMRNGEMWREQIISNWLPGDPRLVLKKVDSE